MSEEGGRKINAATPAELERILREGDLKNREWKAAHPPLSPEAQREALDAARVYGKELRSLGSKIDRARKKYQRMYEDDPKTWQILNFDERVKEVFKRLAQDGVSLNEPERIAVRTALKASTKKMWTTAEAVDAHDGPDNPARIADEAKKRAVAATAENPEGSQDAA